MTIFYVLVNGERWNNIFYFSEFKTAKRKLLIEALTESNTDEDFMFPFLLEFVERENEFQLNNTRKWYYTKEAILKFIQDHTLEYMLTMEVSQLDYALIEMKNVSVNVNDIKRY